jgi:hypothetical protein
MLHHVANKDGPPPRPLNRLEGWLIGTIHAGVLKRLPRYHPLGNLCGQCPEQYALALLAGLRKHAADPRARERYKDDGRAFRSWAESVLAHPAQGFDSPASFHVRGLTA